MHRLVLVVLMASWLAGCATPAAPNPHDANLEFSFHHVNDRACPSVPEEMECRMYSLWLTNTGDAIHTQDLTWLFLFKGDGGDTWSQCPYAHSTPSNFEIATDRRVNLVLSCLTPGTVAQTIAVHHKLAVGTPLDVVPVTA